MTFTREFVRGAVEALIAMAVGALLFAACERVKSPDEARIGQALDRIYVTDERTGKCVVIIFNGGTTPQYSRTSVRLAGDGFCTHGSR